MHTEDSYLEIYYVSSQASPLASWKQQQIQIHAISSLHIDTIVGFSKPSFE